MAEQETHAMHNIQEGASRRISTPKVPDISYGPSRTSSMTAHEPVIRYLDRSKWQVSAFAIYAVLAIFPWVVFCIASRRPLGKTGDYTNFDVGRSDREGELTRILTNHENSIRAAQIVQTISSLLTIPVTSTICSIAFVAFLQASNLRLRLNLRQTMALADQGWISPRIWITISEVGSLPLYIAFALTLFGGVFQILQQSLVQIHSIQATPGGSFWYETMNIPDVAGLVASGGLNTEVVRLRSILDSASAKTFEPNLWSEDGRTHMKRSPGSYLMCDWCMKLLVADDKDQFPDEKGYMPFYFAPLLNGFSSGVYAEPQYAPRINTTVEYTNITLEEYPSRCTPGREDVFFAEYRLRYAHLAACIPSNISSSPWAITHNRQDITEDLFLNVSSTYGDDKYVLYRATAKSSLGYFELPSVHNGYNAGPLLDKLVLPGSRSNSKRSGVGINDTVGTANPGNVTQRIDRSVGPLTSLALALFGEGSFIDTRVSNPATYVLKRPEELIPSGDYTYPVYSGNCMSLMPMRGLTDERLWNDDRSPCIRDLALGSERSIAWGLENWVSYFHITYDVKEKFMMGTYLANKVWLSTSNWDDTSLMYYDEGVTTKKPMLSMTGMIVGSVFLGAHLFGLLFLACYACYIKPWVPWLGAQYMIKAGTAHAGALRSAEGASQWQATVAACPGFVGDERPNDRVGRMAFGAKAGLSNGSQKAFEEL